MIFSFDLTKESVVVLAQIWGFRTDSEFQLDLDTGAEATVIKLKALHAMGIYANPKSARIRVVTASGSAVAAKIVLPKIKVLGKVRTDFEILSYDFPDEIEADGLLGLDFFRGLELNINFKNGQIQLK